MAQVFGTHRVGEVEDIAYAYLYCLTQPFATRSIVTVRWRNHAALTATDLLTSIYGRSLAARELSRRIAHAKHAVPPQYQHQLKRVINGLNWQDGA